MPKLLVIDDEPNIRFSIEEVFDQDDIEVLTAGDFEAGLRVAAEECPDVILLDIQLGDQSGRIVPQHCIIGAVSLFIPPIPEDNSKAISTSFQGSGNIKGFV